MRKIKKMIKGCLSVALVTALLLQAGCAFKDIDKRVFVVGIGIDPSDKVTDGLRITLKMARPVSDVKQSLGPIYAYISHDSESVAEAIRSMETQIDKVLDFGHNRIILMHKDLLSKDLDTFMDFFTRRGDIQYITYVAVADSTAEETIKFEPETETPASIALFNFFDNSGTESPYVVTTFLFEFRREVLGKGIHTVMPIIGIDKENNTYKINKSIILKLGEEPLELNSIDTKYLNSMINNASGFSYKIKENDMTLVLYIHEVKMKYKIILDEGNPRIDMTVKKVGVVGESNKRLNIKHLQKYNKIAADEMESIVTELLTTLQENNVDPFGFGLRYRATRLSRKGITDEWDRIYPEIEFNVKMDIHLKGTGAVE